MDRLDQYRQIVRKLLSDQATANTEDVVECQLLFDTEHDHYQLLDIGWDGLKRIYNCFIHIDIKGDKIWIQRNMTEYDLAKTLIKMGADKEDIILGLHPPYKRPHTGYGVA
ncbi:MAG: XisI protein [Cyanobacteria bacterium J06635_1]